MLDDFFNYVEIRAVEISLDSHAVVMETVRHDWAGNPFRDDLWLYRNADGGSLVQLTQSGHDRGLGQEDGRARVPHHLKMSERPAVA